MRGSWSLGGPYITALHSRIGYFFGPELELYQIRSPSQSFAFMGNRIDYFSSGSSNGLFALLRASSNPFAFMRTRIDYFFEPELGLYQIHSHSQSFAFMGNRIDYFSSGSSNGLFALLRASSNPFAFMRTCIDYFFGPELGLYQIRSPSHSFAFMENRIDYFSSGSSNGLFALLRASSNSFAFMLTHIDHFFSGRSSNGIAQGKHLSPSFYLPPSVGLLLNVRTRFFVRAIAYGKASSLPSIGSLEQFWNVITLELRASLLAGGRRFRFFMFVWFCMVCTKL